MVKGSLPNPPWNMHIDIMVTALASRNIAITEDLYASLEKKKRKDESFTKVIYRLLEENDRPSNYFGAWRDLSEKEENGIKEARRKLREVWQERELN